MNRNLCIMKQNFLRNLRDCLRNCSGTGVSPVRWWRQTRKEPATRMWLSPDRRDACPTTKRSNSQTGSAERLPVGFQFFSISAFQLFQFQLETPHVVTYQTIRCNAAMEMKAVPGPSRSSTSSPADAAHHDIRQATRVRCSGSVRASARREVCPVQTGSVAPHRRRDKSRRLLQSPVPRWRAR